MLDVGKGLHHKYKSLSATTEQIIAELLRASLPGETPVQTTWLSCVQHRPAVTCSDFYP